MEGRILAGHGSGGKLMNELIAGHIRRVLGPESVQLDDSAILAIGLERIAFTTDTFTITPLEFPGGTIGSLAVNGTVNDLAVMGARPLYLSCALLLEEGLEIAVLERILSSMREAADRAGVAIVTGDTKVVERGKADKIFINTAGIGILERGAERRELEPGDAVIINGFIGDHGMSIMALRNDLSFSRGLVSDCAPMNRLIARVTAAFPGSVKFMRDPTRGGVASVLNEIVKGAPFGIGLYESELPIRDEVRGVSEMLGIDPLYAANEGKVLMIARGGDAEAIVESMRSLPEGSSAAVIGRVTEAHPGRAYLETRIGGRRILPVLLEEQLPRIC
ncbi:MAG TPA: hydrogenase expression/formation protein HypE [Spirochaetota bacterium]|mgnify:CR=1 FL=1|jgi:hydrogenase expression/formation protein HypE|nr:hydrogenase expression/formation protein HypE [Spirochaetota bacterium]OPZ37845.1 MAG: Hydrogenase isoenzymes formation protein HypE [Spirochaetes bacterium ADurb.BinA120]HNU90263.1 hydrogenase expression/formation protein HypE [Spirochaetota bacterium]HPV96386.1 hydrogenase expression/formation protein HypE [Spirochaetota bacterium]